MSETFVWHSFAWLSAFCALFAFIFFGLLQERSENACQITTQDQFLASFAGTQY